ncbi:MAG: hypothetical protein KGH60_00410 [Candidatus Micrarchaeota archaeon]|nr:hypothetical protein [Candidatus Micrarchaeota archaeon]
MKADTHKILVSTISYIVGLLTGMAIFTYMSIIPSVINTFQNAILAYFLLELGIIAISVCAALSLSYLIKIGILKIEEWE